MIKNKSYSVGEFSKKTGIPTHTLHYYDEIELLQPKRDASSYHRIYQHQDIVTLQKIMSLKSLGYNLKEIFHLIQEESFNVSLTESLSLHLQVFKSEKEQIERSISSVKRIIEIMEEQGEVESDLLFSLIHSVSTENTQKEWIKQYVTADAMKELTKKSVTDYKTPQDIAIHLVKEVKRLYGKSPADQEVQTMIKKYLESITEYVGEDLLQELAEANIEGVDAHEIEAMVSSPFSQKEEEWFNKAMTYYINQLEESENT